MSRVYRRYLKLLEKWPVDPSKKGRDLGEHLREEVKRAFGSGINFTGNEEKCEEYYHSLKRISDNNYLVKYPRRYTSSASGFNLEECKSILSDEFLEYLETEQPQASKWMKSFKWSKLKGNALKPLKEG